MDGSTGMRQLAAAALLVLVQLAQCHVAHADVAHADVAHADVAHADVAHADVAHAATTHRHRHQGAAAAEVQAPPKWYNTTYSYPDGAGSLIIEGPFPYDFSLRYKNGPSVFSDTNLLGAYGMTVIPGKFDPEVGCTPVPAESPFAGSSSVVPVKMTNGIHDCLLGCNWTEVEATGVDPCNAGSLPKGLGLSLSVMSCFNLGPGTEGHGGGACGYNCTSMKPNRTKGQLVGCTKAESSECNIFCDTRTFPTGVEIIVDATTVPHVLVLPNASVAR